MAIDRILLEKFFANTCTVGEARKVIEWLQTKEGQAYIDEQIEQDARLLQEEPIEPFLPRVESGKAWEALEDEIAPRKYTDVKRLRRLQAPYWRVAAILLVVCVSSLLLYNWLPVPYSKEKQESHPVYYSAGDYEQKVITLRDGTKVRLNSHSKLRVSQDYGQPVRELTLEGEAYFEVRHDPDKPFVIHTSHASIKDIGTAFNVKALHGQGNVQVAVTQGKVSIWSDRETEAQATALVKGQFGYLDLQQRTLEIDRFGVPNYLSWMNGRLQFHEAPLGQVCRQLSRLYPVSFSYADESLKNMTLSMDFERGSLSKVLEVVAMTLDVHYEKEHGTVVWSADTQEHTAR